MINDPHTAWDGPYPYDILATAGVTPHTPHSAMANDVPFDLMAQRLMTPQAQRAWKELSRIQRRLMVDLMLYDVDPVTDVAAALREAEQALADTGAPPEAVAGCLELGPALSTDLRDELGEVALEPPPDLAGMPEFDDPVPPSLLDELTHPRYSKEHG